jgi:hypothetical protein
MGCDAGFGTERVIGRDLSLQVSPLLTFRAT